MRFPTECYQIHQTLRQAMPRLSEARTKGFVLWGARNDNRPKRMPDRSRRRAFLHGRILRRPAETPRVAVRRSRPLHATPQSDRRPRPLRAADEMGLVALAASENPPDGVKVVLHPETTNLPLQAPYGRRLGRVDASRSRTVEVVGAPPDSRLRGKDGIGKSGMNGEIRHDGAAIVSFSPMPARRSGILKIL